MTQKEYKEKIIDKFVFKRYETNLYVQGRHLLYLIKPKNTEYNDSRLIITYNVVDASQPTQLYFYNAMGEEQSWIRGIDMFDKVEIDGTEVSVTDLDAASGTTTQLSVGEHTVAYTLKDPTFIGMEIDEQTEMPTKIGATFIRCNAITSVIIPNSVTSIGALAFRSCSGLTSVTIGDGVTSIGSNAFSFCTSLTSITIPDSVTTIGQGAFGACQNLTSVTIGSGVTSIGDGAFNECGNLTRVEIDSNTIMSATYTNKYNLKNIFGTQVTEYIIGNSVTIIGEMAFQNCRSLTSVTIGSGVTIIGEGVFRSCNNLTSITIGNSVTSIGQDAFSGCEGLTSVTIPDSVTSIGDGAFQYCSGLTSVTIGSGVTSIGNYAFCGCPLDVISKAPIEAINPNATSCSEPK